MDLTTIALIKRLKDELDSIKKMQGPKGDPGKDGKDGKPGRDGKDGKPGKDGTPGKDGSPGKDGKPGDDGNDGISVVDVDIALDHHLVVTLSDGKEIDAGEINSLGDKHHHYAQFQRSGPNLTVGETPPTSPSIGDIWIDTN